MPTEKGYVVLPVDVQRCSSEDLRKSPVWQALIWGAKNGRIAHIVGAPPRTALLQHVATDHKWQSLRYETERDLATRMLVLHAVASAG